MRSNRRFDLARVRSLMMLVSAPLLVAACDRDAPTSPPMRVHARAVALTASQSFPLALEVFVPCAAGGAGELVALSGSLHEVLHLTINGNLFSIAMHDQPQGVKGIGETTGS